MSQYNIETPNWIIEFVGAKLQYGQNGPGDHYKTQDRPKTRIIAYYSPSYMTLDSQ